MTRRETTTEWTARGVREEREARAEVVWGKDQDKDHRKSAPTAGGSSVDSARGNGMSMIRGNCVKVRDRERRRRRGEGKGNRMGKDNRRFTRPR